MGNLREQKRLQIERIWKILENLGVCLSIDVEETRRSDGDIVPSVGWQASEGLKDGLFKVLPELVFVKFISISQGHDS